MAIERGSPGVMQVIRERKLSDSQPLKREDPYKVGLVIEGGAMRGIIPGGMAKALGELGVKDTFDAVYGVSAGAATGAYLLARQADAISIYYDFINNSRFINPARTPIVDIPYLVYNVMCGQKPLHWRKVRDSDIPLHIFVASAKDAKTVDFHSFENENDLFDALHYAMRIPVLAGDPWHVKNASGDHYYTDAGVTTGGVSYREALKDGCTHMLVLVSNSGSQLSSYIGGLCGFLAFRKRFPELAKKLLEMTPKYNQITREMKQASPQVHMVRVDEKVKLSLLETNRNRLIYAAEQGRYAALETFKRR